MLQCVLCEIYIGTFSQFKNDSFSLKINITNNDPIFYLTIFHIHFFQYPIYTYNVNYLYFRSVSKILFILFIY